jgi:hypothetical protein
MVLGRVCRLIGSNLRFGWIQSTEGSGEEEELIEESTGDSIEESKNQLKNRQKNHLKILLNSQRIDQAINKRFYR